MVVYIDIDKLSFLRCGHDASCVVATDDHDDDDDESGRTGDDDQSTQARFPPLTDGVNALIASIMNGNFEEDSSDDDGDDDDDVSDARSSLFTNADTQQGGRNNYNEGDSITHAGSFVDDKVNRSIHFRKKLSERHRRLPGRAIRKLGSNRKGGMSDVPWLSPTSGGSPAAGLVNDVRTLVSLDGTSFSTLSIQTSTSSTLERWDSSSCSDSLSTSSSTCSSTYVSDQTAESSTDADTTTASSTDDYRAPATSRSNRREFRSRSKMPPRTPPKPLGKYARSLLERNRRQQQENGDDADTVDDTSAGSQDHAQFIRNCGAVNGIIGRAPKRPSVGTTLRGNDHCGITVGAEQQQTSLKTEGSLLYSMDEQDVLRLNMDPRDQRSAPMRCPPPADSVNKTCKTNNSNNHLGTVASRHENAFPMRGHGHATNKQNQLMIDLARGSDAVEHAPTRRGSMGKPAKSPHSHPQTSKKSIAMAQSAVDSSPAALARSSAPARAIEQSPSLDAPSDEEQTARSKRRLPFPLPLFGKKQQRETSTASAFVDNDSVFHDLPSLIPTASTPKAEYKSHLTFETNSILASVMDQTTELYPRRYTKADRGPHRGIGGRRELQPVHTNDDAQLTEQIQRDGFEQEEKKEKQNEQDIEKTSTQGEHSLQQLSQEGIELTESTAPLASALSVINETASVAATSITPEEVAGDAISTAPSALVAARNLRVSKSDPERVPFQRRIRSLTAKPFPANRIRSSSSQKPGTTGTGSHAGADSGMSADADFEIMMDSSVSGLKASSSRLEQSQWLILAESVPRPYRVPMPTSDETCGQVSPSTISARHSNGSSNNSTTIRHKLQLKKKWKETVQLYCPTVAQVGSVMSYSCRTSAKHGRPSRHQWVRHFAVVAMDKAGIMMGGKKNSATLHDQGYMYRSSLDEKVRAKHKKFFEKSSATRTPTPVSAANDNRAVRFGARTALLECDKPTGPPTPQTKRKVDIHMDGDGDAETGMDEVEVVARPEAEAEPEAHAVMDAQPAKSVGGSAAMAVDGKSTRVDLQNSQRVATSTQNDIGRCIGSSALVPAEPNASARMKLRKRNGDHTRSQPHSHSHAPRHRSSSPTFSAFHIMNKMKKVIAKGSKKVRKSVRQTSKAGRQSPPLSLPPSASSTSTTRATLLRGQAMGLTHGTEQQQRQDVGAVIQRGRREERDAAEQPEDELDELIARKGGGDDDGRRERVATSSPLTTAMTLRATR